MPRLRRRASPVSKAEKRCAIVATRQPFLSLEVSLRWYMHFDAVEGTPRLKHNRKASSLMVKLAKSVKFDPLSPGAQQKRGKEIRP